MPSLNEYEASFNEKNDLSKIFLVDDHPIVRQGLSELINQQDDLEVCGTADNALEALEAMKKLKPDLLIVDFSGKSQRR